MFKFLDDADTQALKLVSGDLNIKQKDELIYDQDINNLHCNIVPGNAVAGKTINPLLVDSLVLS